MPFEKGDKFITEQESARIGLQEKWRRMYHSQEVYQISISSDGTRKKVDPLLPLPNTVSEIFSDLLFLKFPKVTFQNDTQDALIKPILKDLRIKLLEAAALNSAMGMLWWCLWKENGRTFWRFKTPDTVLWDKQGERLVRLVFFQSKGIKNQHETFFTQEYQLVTKGFGVDGEPLEIVVFTEQEIKVRVGDKEIVEQIILSQSSIDLPFIPAVEVLNLGQLGSNIGKSDYQGREQLFAEIDARIDQINTVLYDQSEPWTFLPPGVLNEGGAFNRQNGKFVEKAPGGQADNEVSITTWDASLSAAFEQIKLMVRMVFFTSRISPPIAGLDEGGQAESGRALKWRSINTFSSVARRQIYWENSIRTFFEYLSQMDPTYKSLTIDTMIIEWQNALPLDEDAAVANLSTAIQNKLISQLKAIMKLQQIDSKKAQEEIDRITEDNRKQMEAFQATQPVTL